MNKGLKAAEECIFTIFQEAHMPRAHLQDEN
jgi:hypothetical protein